MDRLRSLGGYLRIQSLPQLASLSDWAHGVHAGPKELQVQLRQLQRYYPSWAWALHCTASTTPVAGAVESKAVSKTKPKLLRTR